MLRDYKVYLEDILGAIAKIRGYTTNHSLKTFSKDSKTLDAVVRNLEVIGEAIKTVPDNIRMQHPTVKWKRIAGLRDILIHQYFGIEPEIIWDIVQNKLSELQIQIEKIIEK